MYWHHGISHKLKREDQHLVAWRLLNFTHHHLVTYCWDMNLIQGYSRLYWSSYTKKWESNWTVLMCYDDLRSIAYRQRPHKEKKSVYIVWRMFPEPQQQPKSQESGVSTSKTANHIEPAKISKQGLQYITVPSRLSSAPLICCWLLTFHYSLLEMGKFFSHETERWTESTKTSGVMGVFRSLSFISAVTGLHWEYAKTPPDTSLARSSLLPQSNASRQLIRYIWCNLVSSVFSATLSMNSFRFVPSRSYYETSDPFPGKHVDPLLRYSCLALRAAPKIATVAMLWRFVQAFPNQMIETTTDRNFLAWKTIARDPKTS